MTESHYPPYLSSHGSMAPIIWYESLPEHVKRLYKLREMFSQQPVVMVVLAEVVCDAFTIWALGELFKKKNAEDLWKVMSNGSKVKRFQDICNKETNKIYTALSGDQITQSAFWGELQQHSTRRNNLVHPDHTAPTAAAIPWPSQEEADRSFKAVEEYIQHVHGILKSI